MKTANLLQTVARFPAVAHAAVSEATRHCPQNLLLDVSKTGVAAFDAADGISK